MHCRNGAALISLSVSSSWASWPRGCRLRQMKMKYGREGDADLAADMDLLGMAGERRVA